MICFKFCSIKMIVDANFASLLLEPSSSFYLVGETGFKNNTQL